MAGNVSVVDFVNRVLDLTWQRHEVIADNIAKAGQPGATRLGMSFDSALSEIQKAYSSAESTGLYGVDLDSYINETGEDIVLENELVDLTRNTLLYQGLVTARSGYTDIMSMAISGEIK